MNRLQRVLRCLVAALALVGGHAGYGADLSETQALAVGEAVRWVPADAALCGAVLRVREQVEAAGETRAWGRLAGMPIWRQLAEAWDLPATQLAREMLYAKLTEPGTTGAQVDVLLNDPQLRRVAELGLDMLDEEFVWYADANAADFLRLLWPGEPLGLDLRLEDGALDAVEVQRAVSRRMAERVAQSLAERETPPTLPAVVWAFRVSDIPRAAEQLGKLELVGSLLCWTRPELRGRLGRRNVAGQSVMTLSLSGRLAADWLHQRLASLDVDAAAAERLVAAVSDSTLVATLGMRQDYLVLAIGPSLEAVEAMLAGGDRLVDRPEMSPVRGALRQRLTGLAYASPAMAAVLRDSAGPAQDAPAVELGPMLTYSAWTDRGLELVTFDWPAGKAWADVEPLRLLPHAGERPLLLAAWRCAMDREQLEGWVGCVEHRAAQWDGWFRTRLTGAPLRYYRVGVALWRPFGRRTGEAVRHTVFPLLERGQGMVVVGATRTEAGQWVVRPAVVLDLSHAKDFLATYAELGQMAAEIRAAMADAEFTPQAADAFEGPSVHSWGEESASWAPSVGLSDRVAVLALSPLHASELLAPQATPPTALADGPAELLSVVYVDGLSLAELVRPTGHRAAAALADLFARTDADSDSADCRERRHSQVDALFDVLGVVRSVSRRSYLVDGALVTHWLIELRDIDERAAETPHFSLGRQ